LLSNLELDQGCFGGAVCSIFGGGPPVAALPVHQENLAASRLLLPHHAHRCAAACVWASAGVSIYTCLHATAGQQLTTHWQQGTLLQLP
jgi:hypothetical protein